MYKKADIEIYAFKPDALGIQNTDSDIDYGLRAAKALGASHVTLEYTNNEAHTLKLGKAAEKHGMKIGYHGHEQQTFTLWDTALAQSPASSRLAPLGYRQRTVAKQIPMENRGEKELRLEGYQSGLA